MVAAVVEFGEGCSGAPLTETAASGAGKKWPREGNGKGGGLVLVVLSFSF